MSEIVFLNPAQGSVVSILKTLLAEAESGELVGFALTGFPKKGPVFRSAGGQMSVEHFPMAIAAYECEKARLVNALTEIMDDRDDEFTSPGLTS